MKYQFICFPLCITKAKNKMENIKKFPKTYKVTHFKTDFEGRKICPIKIKYSYLETVKNQEEEQIFFESFDGGNDCEINKV